MSILLFIAVIMVLVFVHELGHFLFAKATGCRVDEFAVGFKPALYQKAFRGTNYVLGMIPLGGYVKIWGENGSSEIENDKDNPVAFYNRPRPAQILVLLGGIIFNVVFAWMLLVIVFLLGTQVPQSSFPDHALQDSRIEILQVVSGSPVEHAGIVVGDTVTEISYGDMYARDEAATVESFIQAHADKEMQITYEHEGVVVTQPIKTFEYKEKIIIGFGIETIGTIKLSFIESIQTAFSTTFQISKAIMIALGNLLIGLFSNGEGIDQLSGPVGIASYAQDSFSLGTSSFLYFVALLSLNLAMFNLLPIPALDGGRIVFVLIESIMRRPLDPHWFLWINALGFGLLLLLMLWVTFQDIIKIFI